MSAQWRVMDDWQGRCARCAAGWIMLCGWVMVGDEGRWMVKGNKCLKIGRMVLVI